MLVQTKEPCPPALVVQDISSTLVSGVSTQFACITQMLALAAMTQSNFGHLKLAC